jgi:hypothetical protein
MLETMDSSAAMGVVNHKSASLGPSPGSAAQITGIQGNSDFGGERGEPAGTPQNRRLANIPVNAVQHGVTPQLANV